MGQSRPKITEDRKKLYRKDFDEAWYEEKCAQYRMDEYSWDIEQFRFNEKQVQGNYGYICETNVNDTDRLTQLYQQVVMFLKCCQQPRHVEGRTLLNLKTFGEGSLHQNTRVKLVNWAFAITKLDEIMRLNKNVDWGTWEDQRKFASLVKICQTI